MPSRLPVVRVALTLVVLGVLAGTATIGISASPPAGATDAAPADSIGRVRDLVRERRFVEAESLARVWVAVAERSTPTDSALLAQALEVLTTAMAAGGKAAQPEAKEAGERSLGIRERRFGMESPHAASSLGALGTLALERNDLAAARSYHERALAIREKALSPEHPDVAASLHGLGGVLARSSDYPGAAAYLERALAIRERALGPKHPELQGTLHNLATVKRRMGDNAATRALLERLIDLEDGWLGPRHPVVITHRWLLAMTFSQMGLYPEARALYERTLAETEAVLGPSHPDVADRLIAFALLKGELGDYGGARVLLERAVDILERVPGPAHPRLAGALSILSGTLRVMGACEDARPLLEHALEVNLKSYGPDDLRTALAQAELGTLLVDLEDLAAARPLLEQAMKTQEASPDRQDIELSATLQGLAKLDECTGDRSVALEKLDRWNAIIEKASGSESPRLTGPLKDLAKFHCRAGDYDLARPLLDRALAIRAKVPGELGRDLPWMWILIAEISAARGDTTHALEEALRADRIGREQILIAARSLAEREVLRMASTREPALSFALTLGTRAGSAETWTRLADAMFRNRALVLDEIASRNRAVARSTDPEVLRLASRVTAAREKLAGVYLRGQNRPAAEATRAVEEARREKEEAERALATRNLAFREEHARSRAGFAEVSAAIPAASALVSWQRYEHRTGEGVFAAFPMSEESKCVQPRPGANKGVPEFVERYLVLVTRPGDEPVCVPLGSAATIDTLIARWRREVLAGLSAPPWRRAESERACRAIGDSLRRAVWDPIAPALQNLERVFVVPDGAISLIDLEALPVGDAFLAEQAPPMHLLSAERDLIPMSHSAPRSGLMVVADPDFDVRPAIERVLSPGAIAASQPGPAAQTTQVAFADDAAITDAGPFRGRRFSCRSFASVRFGRLPAAARESRRARDLWSGRSPNRRGPSGAAAPGLTLRGEHATEAAFKREAPGHEVLHLATHGFFIGDECTFAPTEPPKESSVGGRGCAEARLVEENPLARSGLALAGANRRAEFGTDLDDGLLTAEEIAALDLSSARWAVLSACETGLGVVRAGEGVFGLRRAFQVAGAGTLFMSLWPISDETSLQWVEKLYREHYVQGRDIISSMRQTRLALLKDRRARGASTHPAFWAGFVASGEWR